MSTRTATAAHAMTFLAYWTDDGVQSSATIADSLESNPVLVRRVLGALRDAGLVYALEGSGGGWQLTKPAEEISLLDAYAAVEDSRALLPTHAHTPNQGCVIGRHAQSVLEAEFTAAQRALDERLAQTSIAEILDRILGHEHTGASSR
ncbi:Rrf2 family transcriptional regulator [Ruania zhangjianzhongii]|uniref:Rrf2 family transcriptional regulator n=1 Tax=Ruania zhangjianzhongii TaxID=2603206 RepID=UPI001AEF5525|nr:Rrf2 family transcriptional regulator [Ruania zhangjianzhongii]